VTSLYQTEIHPRVASHDSTRPVRVADQLPTDSRVQRFNAWLAVKITSGVGTMWCAYAFAALALISLPDAIRTGRPAIISWIAQTFLQLVLLSIIIVGQNIQSAAADRRTEETYKDVEALMHQGQQLEAHLRAQDAAIMRIMDHLGIASAPG
jgi:hypothetical protein